MKYFSWMVKIFYKGVRRGLTVKDLHKTLKEDQSENVGNKLEKNWEEELARAKKNNREPSLVRAVTYTFIWRYMFYGLLLFIQFVILRYVNNLIYGCSLVVKT